MGLGMKKLSAPVLVRVNQSMSYTAPGKQLESNQLKAFKPNKLKKKENESGRAK